jgi:hypothetical protein
MCYGLVRKPDTPGGDNGRWHNRLKVRSGSTDQHGERGAMYAEQVSGAGGCTHWAYPDRAAIQVSKLMFDGCNHERLAKMSVCQRRSRA